MYIDFTNLLNEKMGIISRVNQTTDVFHISELSNKFIDEIYKDVDNICILYEYLLDHAIKLKYDPNTKNNGAETNGDNIYIYTKANKNNKYIIKYLIIHELIHVIQKIRSSDHIEHYNYIELVRYYLRNLKFVSPNENDDEETIKHKYFLYMLYREKIYEISAWGNNAYIKAYLYKIQYPNMVNQRIINQVLSDVYMTQNVLNNVIDSIKYNDETYNIIISILIGHFSELDGNTGQSYFDKSVFNLDVIKKMREDANVLNLIVNGDPEELAEELFDLIPKYKHELNQVKGIIISSFIKHLQYWFKKAQVQLGKAIQLGIDDASPKKFTSN